MMMAETPVVGGWHGFLEQHLLVLTSPSLFLKVPEPVKDAPDPADPVPVDPVVHLVPLVPRINQSLLLLRDWCSDVILWVEHRRGS